MDEFKGNEIKLEVKDYDSKEKIVSALASNGYFVNAVQKKDSLYRSLGWEITIIKDGE